MVEAVFTLDYEIYGNGAGSLRDLVYEPAEKLRKLFKEWNARCVFFVEAAELEVIDRHASDPYIGHVKEQVRTLYKEGFELGLHLHPQWYNGRREDGRWVLDNSEYNLCTLPEERIAQIVDASISYLRSVVDDQDFTPVSFRAGNWLFQPTEVVAGVLASRGIRVDSSVFKGGLQHQHKLDYRRARSNGPFWRFSENVNASDPEGKLLEIPIYTRMVPFWRMLTGRRIELQSKGAAAAGKATQSKAHRLIDYLRFSYPLKLDFCRMGNEELRLTMEAAVREAARSLGSVVDTAALEALLAYVKANGIPIARLDDVCARCEHVERRPRQRDERRG
jgi:hypothetical protein